MDEGGKRPGPASPHEPATDGDGAGRGVRSRVAARYAGTALGRALRAPADAGAASDDPPTIDDAATAAVEHKDGGRPVAEAVRGPVEAQLGVDLSGARVHDDPLAHQASTAMGARAFAHGEDVFLGPGESDGDLGLMAHELTHVAQQGTAGARALQRKVQVGDPNSPAEAHADAVAGAVTAGEKPPALLVDDAPVGPGQMLKSTFLEQLRTAVSTAAADELGPLGSVVGCPYIDQYFGRYSSQPASVGEALVRRYAPAARGARTAADMIAPVVARVREGVRQWRDTGQPPADLAAAEPGAAAAATAAATAAAPKLAEPGSPADVAARLGPGEPLDAATASRMEDGFGESFAAVRVHTDATAARLAADHGAHAFTVGSHVAFAPGTYQPGTVGGDALIAHELAHVSQQAGAGPVEQAVQRTPSDDGPAEADADTATRGVLSRLYGGVKSAARAVRDGLTTPIGLKRCGGADVSKGLITSDLKGDFLGKKVGSSSSKIVGGIPVDVDMDLKAARTLGAFDTEAAALAAVKTNGKPGAVTVEKAKYVAYETDLGFLYRDDYVADMQGGGTFFHPPKLAPGVIALVSNELMTVRAGQFDPGAKGDVQGSANQQLASTANPFDGYKQALGDAKGDLNAVDNDKLLAAFSAAMKDTALVVLNRSAAEVKTKQSHFDHGGAGVSDSEFETMKATAKDLADDDSNIALAKQTLGGLNLSKAMASGPAGGYANPLYDKDIEAAQAKLSGFETQRKIHLAKYPLLSRVDPAEFVKLKTKDEMAGKLGGELPGIQKDIETTKQNVADGKINLWGVDQIVDATIAGFGLDEAKRKVIMEAKAAEAKKKTIETVVFTVFAIGFGIAAAFATGGAALFFAAGAFGLSTYDAMKQTDQYMVDKPASNVALDKDGGFAAPPGWGWLVVAWIGVGLDATMVASAVGKIAKAEVSVADAAKELAKDAKRLGMTEEELLKKLRSLAGDVDGAAKVTESTKGALAGKLGLPVDIDPKLAGDVRVYYEVDKATGRVTLKSLAAGPEATMAEILAHERLINHMRRYEGVTGRLRELWEKLLAFAGKSPSSKNPFEAGSKAWESWNELYKLPDVVDAQFLKYRDGLRPGNETTLVKDLEILEEEARRHRAIVEEMVGEAGSGFVAKTGDSTRAAIAAGYPLPAGVTTAEELLAKGYYYRSGANGTYDLVRKTTAGVDQLRVEFDVAGKPLRLVGAVEKLEARITDAAQLQRLRALASDADIGRLYDKVGDATRLENLLKDAGSIGKLDTLLGKVAKPADLERLLHFFTGSELDTLLAHLKDPELLLPVFDHVNHATAKNMLLEMASKGKVDKLNQFVERMAAGGAQLGENATVGAKSLIIDSQAAIALAKDAAGEPLQSGEKAWVAYIKSLPGDVELRVGNVTVGEIKGGVLNVKGVPIDVAREAPEYQKVLATLESQGVGSKTGFADRAVVADALFAKVEPGVVPKLLTGDTNAVKNLARLAGLDVVKEGGYPGLAKKFGETGFKVTIEGREIMVVPLPPAPK